MREKKVDIVFDETPDSQHRLFFNIMVSILSEDLSDSKPSYRSIFHTTFLKNACNSGIGVQGLHRLYTDGIQFNDVLLILTDAAHIHTMKVVNGLTRSLISNAISQCHNAIK